MGGREKFCFPTPSKVNQNPFYHKKKKEIHLLFSSLPGKKMDSNEIVKTFSSRFQNPLIILTRSRSAFRST